MSQSMQPRYICVAKLYYIYHIRIILYISQHLCFVQGASWVSVFLLIAVVVTYVIVLILFGIRRKKKPRETSTTKTSFEKMDNVAI